MCPLPSLGQTYTFTHHSYLAYMVTICLHVLLLYQTLSSLRECRIGFAQISPVPPEAGNSPIRVSVSQLHKCSTAYQEITATCTAHVVLTGIQTCDKSGVSAKVSREPLSFQRPDIALDGAVENVGTTPRRD